MPPTKAPTVTEILTAYRDGSLPRERMLDAMRTFPWKAVKKGAPLSETAWENLDWPQPGTVQEVYAATIDGIISVGDRDAILDVLREPSSA